MMNLRVLLLITFMASAYPTTAEISITLDPRNIDYSPHSGYILDVPWFLPTTHDITIRFTEGIRFRTTAEEHIGFGISQFGRNELADRHYGILDANGDILMSEMVLNNTIATQFEGMDIIAPENTEFYGLFFSISPELQIFRSDTEVEFRIPPTAILVSDLAGDFDVDGEVTGTDFLTWQRGFGLAFGASELEGWQTNYGDAATPTTSTAVPEPATWLMSLLALAARASRRKFAMKVGPRRRSNLMGKESLYHESLSEKQWLSVILAQGKIELVRWVVY